MTEIKHPGEYLIQELRDKNWTQKYFSHLLGKKVSEVNELIKGKRNITIQRDLLLSKVLGSSEKSWMNRQIDYDYSIAKRNFDDSKIQKVEKMNIPAPINSIKPVNQAKKIKVIQKNNQENIQKNNIIQKTRKHEGIFRDF